MRVKINKICAQCVHDCKQSDKITLVSCPKFKRPETVTWSCHHCEAEHEIEYATNKQILHCSKCEAIHKVMGHHIDGRPIVRLYATRKE